MDRLQEIASRFSTAAPVADYWSLRLVEEETDQLAVRQGVAEPSSLNVATGAMVTLVTGGGVGYGATSDLSPPGLLRAARRAGHWAGLHARLGLFDAALYPRSEVRADYRTRTLEPWDTRSAQDKFALLQDACAALSAWCAGCPLEHIDLAVDDALFRSPSDIGGQKDRDAAPRQPQNQGIFIVDFPPERRGFFGMKSFDRH